KQSSSGDGKFRLRIRAGHYQPMLEVLALIKRNRAGSQRSARARAWILRRAQASPANPAGKTKAIKPFGVVVGNARGEDSRLTRVSPELAPTELLKNRLQPFQPFDAVFLVSTLPREQKAIKILL